MIFLELQQLMQRQPDQVNIPGQNLDQQNSQSLQSNQSKQEDIEDYNIGGFHPVFIGEVLNDRYLMRKKIKTTQYSQVWMAIDIKYDFPVCIKIYQASPYYTEVGLLELKAIKKIYQKSKTQKWIDQVNILKERYCLDNVQGNENFCVKYLNSFKHDGPHGTHLCIVYEYLGTTLDQFIKNFSIEQLPYPVVKKIALQIAIGIKFLHQECQMIHCNLKPENIMLTIPFKQMVIQKEKFDLEQYDGRKRQLKEKISIVIKKIILRLEVIQHNSNSIEIRGQQYNLEISPFQKLSKKTQKKVEKEKKKIKKNNFATRRKHENRQERNQ